MSEPETTADEPAADEADATVTDVIAADDPGLQHRLWLKAILPILQLRTTEGEPSGGLTDRAQWAFDRAYIAACERVERILRSDQSGEDEIMR